MAYILIILGNNPRIHHISPAKEDFIISSTFTCITNLANAINTANVNSHLPLWYLPTKKHRGEMINNSNHITLCTNISIFLPPTSQQPNSPEIIVSADLHYCTI